MSYEEVTQSVVLKTAKTGSNIVCIALENELIFVDTGLLTEDATEFRKEMELKFGKKATKLILTHGHIDHFFGMDAFADCKIVAAEQAKTRLESFINLEFTEEVIERFARVFPAIRRAVKTAKLRIPDEWVVETAFFGDNKEIEFHVLGGHSSCSSSIFYVPDKIMLVGDLIQAEVYPYFGEPDTDLNSWLDSLKRWEEMDINYLLPGHGNILNRGYSVGVRTFFEKVIINLKQYKQEGLSEAEIVKKPVFDQGYWPKTAERKPAYDFSLINLYRKL